MNTAIDTQKMLVRMLKKKKGEIWAECSSQEKVFYLAGYNEAKQEELEFLKDLLLDMIEDDLEEYTDKIKERVGS